MTRRRRNRGAGSKHPNQPDYEAQKPVDELESGMAVGYDLLPPNSHLLDANADDPPLPQMAAQVAPPDQLEAQTQEQAFANFPPPPMQEATLTMATDETFVETSLPPKGPDANPDDQKRLTWMIDKIEIGAKRWQGRLVTEVKVRAALTVCSYRMQEGLDPTNRAKKDMILDVAYLTPEPITLVIPLAFLPAEFRTNPAKLTTQIVEKTLTSMFATFPCETVRPRPLPTALTYMPPAMREQLLRQNGLKPKG